ncbi:hypothetical protein [Mucilaginibacter flavidus]|uniref:hypothetical protein n=1 Tax=Mucilaginibacter flavidus TaxID=2949309 RepID=UPI0020925301|nr:hypothetical protein [Mucilaginibacter flavidus]MCO5945724.1 hypothetical protein [Mucilaginibacter flavidus]
MKRLLLLSIIPFFGLNAFAQTKASPAITQVFIDSLSSYIVKIAPPKYSINILYVSPVSEDGKLTDPKIMREEDLDDTVDNSDVVVKLRKFLLRSPAWKPATDETSKVIASKIAFKVIIKKGEIKISQAEPDTRKF